MSRRQGALVSSLWWGVIAIVAGVILEILGAIGVSVYVIIAGAALVVAGAGGLVWHSLTHRLRGGSR